MAPLTIYPNRRHLIWGLVFTLPLALLFLGGAGVLAFELIQTHLTGRMQMERVGLLGLSVLFGLGFLARALSHWLRLRRTDPAMTVEDRGIRLLDRPLFSLAKRPVFVPWAEIASLTFERGQHARNMSIRTHAGKQHKMAITPLGIPAEEMAEECLARAHQAGLIGTSERRSFLIADRTEWRLAGV